jgi:hypothetical protein
VAAAVVFPGNAAADLVTERTFLMDGSRTAI